MVVGRRVSSPSYVDQASRGTPQAPALGYTRPVWQIYFVEVEGKECVLYEDTMITIDVQEPSPTQSMDSPSSSHNEILFTFSDNSEQMSIFSLSCRD